MANRFGLNKKGRKQVKKLTKAMGGKRVEALTGFNLMTGKVSHSVSAHVTPLKPWLENILHLTSLDV